MPMNQFESLMLKTLIGIVLTCVSAFSWYSYSSTTANTQDISDLKASIAGINAKLDIALKDLELHHKIR